MNRRTAATLTEVLIAIACMAIGLISILALFPLGFRDLAEAARNNKMANLAFSARSVFQFLTGEEAINETFLYPEVDSQLIDVPASTPVWPNPPPRAEEDSPALWIDHLGYEAYVADTFQYQLPPPPAGRIVNLPHYLFDPQWKLGRDTQATGSGYASYRGISRKTFRDPMANRADVPLAVGVGNRVFKVEDDIQFDSSGQPAGPPPTRDRAYSFAYMWRRGSSSLTVVMFKNRPANPDAPIVDPAKSYVEFPREQVYLGADVPLASRPPDTRPVFSHNSTFATVAWNTGDPGGVRARKANRTQPAIKKGYWVMDATESNGYFYRIASISEPYRDPANPATGEWRQDLTLEKPARSEGYVAVFMPDVADVIE